MPESVSLFVNVEPSSFGTGCPPDLVEPLAAALASHRRIVLELTERSVTADPAAMLRAVEQARRDAMGLAIDDVGVDPASLAMMPLLRPDIIKLDLSIVQTRTSRAVSRIANAVMAEAERTGAEILAEGIESDRELGVARAMGATLGQGWYFGKPEFTPAPVRAPRQPINVLPAVADAQLSTPFEATRGRRLNQATEHMLRPLSMHLEYRGLDATDPTVLLACFQDADRFGAPTRRRYARLAERGVFTAVLGRNMSGTPGRGIRGAELDPTDPLGREWTVIVLGAHFAAALLARERDHGAADRLFDFVVTHDRDVVIAAALPLIKRIIAQ
jgi:EAL domain-containing protein (putative c-di-GMP-specific phosphodiesterase class I)